MYTHGTHRGQKRASYPLELWLQVVVKLPGRCWKLNLDPVQVGTPSDIAIYAVVAAAGVIDTVFLSDPELAKQLGLADHLSPLSSPPQS